MPGPVAAGRPRAMVAWAVAVAGLCGFGAGCASSGVQGYTETLWREDMGRITQATLENGLDKMIRKYALQLLRDELRGRDLYYELAWQPRDVYAEEEAAGVTKARNRILIRGRRLEDQFDGSGVFRFTWELQNEVSTDATPEWHAAAIPAEVVERYRPIYSDLTLEVRAGVRR